MGVGIAIVAVIVVVLSHILTYLANEHSLLHQCLPSLPKLFFSSNRRLKRHPEQYWAFDVLDPDHLTTSFFVPVWVLALWRLLIPLYCGAELLIEGFTTPNGLGDPGYVWISFFTDWTFCVFGFAGLLGFVVTVWRMIARHRHRTAVQPDAEAANGNAHGAAAGAGASGAAPRKWTFLEVLYLLVFETSASSELFLTVFYWAALASGGNRRADNIMKHGTNNIMILVDILLSREPMVSYHYQVALLYGTVYFIFMWAIWLPIKDYWVYSVLDWGMWRAIGAYAVLPVALFVAFAIWTGIAALREALGRKCAVKRWGTAQPVVPLDGHKAPENIRGREAAAVSGVRQQAAVAMVTPSAQQQAATQGPASQQQQQQMFLQNGTQQQQQQQQQAQAQQQQNVTQQ